MNYWQSRVTHAVAAGGTGNLTLGAATTGQQALSATANGLPFDYRVDDGAAWETGLAVYTHASMSIARVMREASSTGAALDVSTAATVSLSLSATTAAMMDAAAQGTIPGGRLTAMSGTHLPTGDVASTGTIYYTPHFSRTAGLWDGYRWRTLEFDELPLPVSVGSVVLHDVALVLSGGQVAYEFIPWTNNTTRAGPLIFSGHYAKSVSGSADRSRLVVGTFLPLTTTTTCDTVTKRFVGNIYWKEVRTLSVVDTSASWVYATQTVRQMNGASSSNRVEFVLPMQSVVSAIQNHTVALSGNGSFVALAGPGVDSATAFHANSKVGMGYNQSGSSSVHTSLSGSFAGPLSAGYHFIAPLEYGAGGTCAWGGYGSKPGLDATIYT